LTATKGLNYATKCTWQFKTENGTVGPGFYLKTAIDSTFLLHYTEWLDQGAFTSHAIMPTTSGANYHLGTYTPVSGELYLNPLTAFTPDTDSVWGISTWTLEAGC